MLTVYYTPNLGKTSRQRLESIYAETQANAHKSGSLVVAKANTKAEIVRTIRGKREEFLDREGDGSD